MRDVRRIGGEPGKRVDGVFPGRPQSFRHQRRPVDDCSPGQRGMMQNERGAERFMAKWIAAEETRAGLRHSVVLPERDEKDQGEDSPNQAGSCWFARPC